jgi:hypothetical protein
MTFTSCLSPETAHAQEYPSCVSRESDLYRFYKTQEQRQWTASGIGGCTLYPRLLFPIKPRDSSCTDIARRPPTLARVCPTATQLSESAQACSRNPPQVLCADCDGKKRTVNETLFH